MICTPTLDIIEYSEYAEWYRRVCEVYDCFDAVRKDSRFKELCKRIEEDLRYYKLQKRKILK